MTEAPERIWATISGSRISTYSPPFLIGGWESRSRKIEREVEYVRADLYATLEADLATANARADALREAAESDAGLLFDAYKAVLVLHRILDKHGLEMGAKAANEIADRIVKAHPELEAYYLTHATQDAAKDARIRELEKALLPFSEMAGELFAKNWNNDEIAMSVNRDGKCSKLLASAFFDARAVLQGEK